MLHYMKLKKEPFEKMSRGAKTVELRLYDEKRQQVQIGDFIEFTCLEDEDAKQKITVRVTALHRFDSFQELYASTPKEKMGYSENDTVNPDHMDEYYSREEQKKYGVVGIEIHKTELQRFIDAQNGDTAFFTPYNTALEEIKSGFKYSHWIWYVFPQIRGLGFSEISRYFSIRDIDEARDYIAHPVLRERLIEITESALALENNDPVSVFGSIDSYKFRSSMTLFKEAAPELSTFQRALDKFCMGMADEKTLEILYK